MVLITAQNVDELCDFLDDNPISLNAPEIEAAFTVDHNAALEAQAQALVDCLIVARAIIVTPA